MRPYPPPRADAPGKHDARQGGPLTLRDTAVTVAATEPAPVESDERWILIDDFESDGRRYLVARLADARRPERDGFHPLSARDLIILAKRAKGQSVKAIAIETKLAPSTVSRILVRASRTFGETWRGRLVPRGEEECQAAGSQSA